MPSSSETHGVGSSSNLSKMDQRNLPVDPVEMYNLPEYMISPGDAHILDQNTVHQPSANLNLWNSNGSSSMEFPPSGGSHGETKMQESWMSSMAVTSRGSLGVEGRRLEGTGLSSMEDVNLNLNVDPFLETQSSRQSMENAGMGTLDAESEQSSLPRNGVLLPPEHALSTGIPANALGRSSGSTDLFSEDSGGRQPDAHRSSSKRKNMVGASWHSSASGSTSNAHQNGDMFSPSYSASHDLATSLNMSSLSNYGNLQSPIDDLNASFDTFARPVAFDYHSSSSDPHGADAFLRNTRIRSNLHQNSGFMPGLLPQGCSFGHSHNLSAPQSSSAFSPFNQAQELWFHGDSRSSLGHPPVELLAHFSRDVHSSPVNGNFSSRIEGSSSSTATTGERSTPDGSNWRLPRSSFSESFMLGDNNNDMVEDSTNRRSMTGSRSLPERSSSALHPATNAGTEQLFGSNMTSDQSSPTNYQRLSAILRRSLSPGGSLYRSQRVPLQHHDHSFDSHEAPRNLTGASIHGHQQSLLRSTPFTDRQRDGFLDVPVLMRGLPGTREGRNRMMSEQMRDVLDLLQQGENMRFEDFLDFSRPMLVGRINLHDNYRDLRLDVDNMSYEELLALEERIGNVSTGLGEEQIMKCLEQRKYIPVASEPSGCDPCCICREEYIEGEETGKLGCGHKFHAACIKQWLVLKNSCPICKTSALAD